MHLGSFWSKLSPANLFHRTTTDLENAVLTVTPRPLQHFVTEPVRLAQRHDVSVQRAVQRLTPVPLRHATAELWQWGNLPVLHETVPGYGNVAAPAFALPPGATLPPGTPGAPAAAVPGAAPVSAGKPWAAMTPQEKTAALVATAIKAGAAYAVLSFAGVF